MKLIIVVTVLCCIVTSGCSTPGKSVLMGMTVGGTTGAALGNTRGMGSRRDRLTFNGLLIGTAIGGLLGWASYKPKKKKTISLPEIDLAPLLTLPKIKKIWVKDEIKNKRFIKGHWEYIIKENSQWSK